MITFPGRGYWSSPTGQEDLLKPRLVQIRAGRKHLVPGTVARYITRNCAQPGEIQVVLIWRSTGMPTEAEREAAVQELRAELDDLLDWSTATSMEGPIALNT